jgi:hypothetical protein
MLNLDGKEIAIYGAIFLFLWQTNFFQTTDKSSARTAELRAEIYSYMRENYVSRVELERDQTLYRNNIDDRIVRLETVIQQNFAELRATVRWLAENNYYKGRKIPSSVEDIPLDPSY